MKTLTLVALCLITGTGQAQTAKRAIRPAAETVQKKQEPEKKQDPKPAPAPSTLMATAHVLQIFSENGEKFFLILDGEKINAEPKAKVVARDLDKGFYRFKIIFDDERLPDFNGNVQLEGVEPGWNEVTHRIKKKTKKGKISYSLGYGDWKKIGEATPTRNQEALNNDPVDKPDNYVPPAVTPGTEEVVRPKPTPLPTTACGAALPEAAFQGFLTSIENANFEDTKVQTANVILDGNCLTAMQVKQVIQKFGFEQSRLNFAQTAYNRCLDKQNYLVVNDGFQFNSSKDAMNRYVLEQKK